MMKPQFRPPPVGAKPTVMAKPAPAIKKPKAPRPEEDPFWQQIVDLKDANGKLMLRGTRLECKQLVMSHSTGFSCI
jgi:hypothetical protein